VTNLPPGTYRIEVEKLGFKVVIKSDLVLHVQDALEINFEMTLGSASESVTVRGGAPPLDAESSTIGTVVEQRKVNELPLNGRNVFNLIELAASVVPQGSSTGTPVGVNPFGWGNYQVNGSFGNESAEYLDGQPLNIGYINLPILIPTQDSIQEFKVQTSNLGPEWGKFSGGVTNLSTKDRNQLDSRRNLRIPPKQNLQRQRFFSERCSEAPASLGTKPVWRECGRTLGH
jgi:hypothetical protein